MPTVSLVIATYNYVRDLPATLATVLAQTRPFDEIIVVDDCSPDDTIAYLQANYPQIRTIQTPTNGGTSAARNFGARAATGDVIVFFDHDDLMHPGALVNFLELFAEFPEAEAAFTDNEYRHTGCDLYFPNHHFALQMYRRFHQIRPIRRTAKGRLYGREMYKALLRGNLLQQPYAIRRDTFFRIGCYAEDVRFCEDWDLYLRLTRTALIANSDAISSVHIQRGEGANLSLDRRQDPMHRRVLLRRLRAEAFRDPASALLVAQRLASYYKKAGDQEYATAFWSAWRNYVKSFLLWPFDLVVFCGAVLFFLPWILTGKQRKVLDPVVALPQALNANSASEDTAAVSPPSSPQSH